MKKKIIFGSVAAAVIVAGGLYLNEKMQSSYSKRYGTPQAEYMASDSGGSSDEAGPKSLTKSAEAGKSEETMMSPKLIKTGSISLQAASREEMKKAKEFVRQKMAPFQARFAKEEESASDYSLSATYIVRVPSDQFDAFLDAIASGGFSASNRSVEVSDVTERYIDLETHLKNKRMLLERYKDVLRKAQRVADIITINSSIESVSSEIDTLEGQFRYLKNQVSLSTLTITANAPVPATTANHRSFASDFALALNDGWNTFRAFVLWTASLWVFLLPLLAVCGWWLKRQRRFAF